MSYLERLIDLRRATAGKVISILMAIMLAFSMTNFMSTLAYAATAGEEQTQVKTEAQTADKTDGTEKVVEKKQAPAAPEKSTVIAAAGDSKQLDAASDAENSDTAKGTDESKLLGDIIEVVDEFPTSADLCADGEHELEFVYIAPTCKTPGYDKKVCKNCDYELILEEFEAMGHKIDGAEPHILPKAATCTEDGCTEGLTCMRDGCPGETSVTIIAGHKYGDWKQVVRPTCSTMGLEEAICEVCGDKVTRNLPKKADVATDHEGFVYTKEVEPTCTTVGYTEGSYCTVCQKFIRGHEVIPALPHEIVIDKAVAPTCTATGLTEGKHCQNCDAATVAQDKVPMLEHEFEYDTQFPTCTEPGYDKVTCKNCDYENNEILPAEGHKGEIVAGQAPTCTEDGYAETMNCFKCGLVEAEVLPATGHEYGEWETIEEPTVDNEGLEQRVCAHDASHIETRAIAALPVVDPQNPVTPVAPDTTPDNPTTPTNPTMPADTDNAAGNPVDAANDNAGGDNGDAGDANAGATGGNADDNGTPTAGGNAGANAAADGAPTPAADGVAGATPAAPAAAVPAAAAPAAAPAADGAAAVAIPDDATPLADVDQIDDDANPLAPGVELTPECWVHWIMILGIIVSIIYGAGVIISRRNEIAELEAIEDRALGRRKPANAAVRVRS